MPCSRSYAARKAWISDMRIVSSIPLRAHPCSHRRQVGQTWAQVAARTLFLRMVRTAPLRFPSRSCRMKVAGSLSAPQPALHGAS